ncbi:MAG: leucyl/phenylalanyl-tRNA--protein transferase [Gammaproteobacteria bacterium]
MYEPPIIWLPDEFSGVFPSTRLALLEPDGLLAAGGNLKPATILQAYSQGIFPWYSDDQPILWWSPNPRCVLLPQKFHISRSFRRTLNKQPFEIRVDTAFRDVMLACAESRPDQESTWITDEMLDAYCSLHDMGYAHSVECWQSNRLVGGIYGLQLGAVFFGESMFSRMKDASKVALHHVCSVIKPALLDAQVYSPHLESLGAELIEREDFIRLLQAHIS